MNYADYQELLNRYLDGAMSSRDFQNRYLEKFKKENRHFPGAVFDILDTLFSDVDTFCPDAGLLEELNLQNPGYYGDEQTLRKRVSEARRQLMENSITATQARAL